MADAKYDVLGIGNAIFDVLVQTDEKFLADHGMTKGGMALIEALVSILILALGIFGLMGIQARSVVETRITNNLVLKKLRVAFQLKDVDMHDTFIAAGFPLTKPELTALFRQPGHKHYRPCGDQILRNFLKGLTLRYRTGE